MLTIPESMSPSLKHIRSIPEVGGCSFWLTDSSSTRNNREDDDEDKYIERDREVRIDEGFDTYNTRDKRDDRRGDDRFRDPKPSIRDQDKDVERRPDEGDPNIRDQRIINLQRDGTFTGVGGSQSGSGAKEEYEAGVKEEAKFVKDVDQLELAWQMEEYEKSGNGQLDREDGQASDVWGSKRDDQGNLNDTRDRRDGNNPLLPAAVTWDLILSHPLFK